MSNMPKPTGPYTSRERQTNPFMPLNIPDPSIYKQSFDQLLQNRGIRFVHRKAIPCPNMRSLNDVSHEPNCPICDGNGMYYYEEKEIYGVFTSNNIEKNYEQQGVWEIGTAVITFPAEYADGTQAEFNAYDQLVMSDFTVRMWQLKEYEPTVDDTQQLRYPIDTFEYMSSIENGSLVEYTEDTDFEVTLSGNIKWIGTTPGYDTTTERGSVYNIMYFANPVYVVMNPMRELRVTQQLVDGIKTPIRLPQQVAVRRDFLSNPPESE